MLLPGTSIYTDKTMKASGPLQCPKGKYHKFFMGLCDNCGMTKRQHTKLTAEARKTSLNASRARKRAKPAIHRAMEGLESRSICGVENCGPAGEHQTTFNWKQITCPTCLKERSNYD